MVASNESFYRCGIQFALYNRYGGEYGICASAEHYSQRHDRVYCIRGNTGLYYNGSDDGELYTYTCAYNWRRQLMCGVDHEPWRNDDRWLVELICNWRGNGGHRWCGDGRRAGYRNYQLCLQHRMQCYDCSDCKYFAGSDQWPNRNLYQCDYNADRWIEWRELDEQ